MKLIGLIGGVSPESTLIYYRLLNDAARVRLGGEHSASIMLYTLDYDVMIDLYHAGDWAGYASQVATAATLLKRAGVDALAITSNTSHIGAQAAQAATGLPIVHVMDALTDVMKKAGSRRPLLLGTPFTMSGDFYLPELSRRYDGEVLVPTASEQRTVGRIIFDELVNSDIRDSSRNELLAIIANSNCDGVILGCTELCMILGQQHTSLPVYDTTALHVAALSAFAFGEG